MAELRKFIISTDSTADLPEEYVRQHNIIVHPVYYVVDEVRYGGDVTIPLSRFYQMMREGAVPTTTASNPDAIRTAFEKYLKEGYDILHISFSSGLSCSHNNATFVANELLEEYPDSRITIVDSLCASMGQGLFVYYAVKLHDEGKSMDEIEAWLLENRLHICHQFTVEDLKYLYRGGRVSKTAAILGTVVNVKPVLHVDNDGHLIALSKVRGRKKSLIALVDNMLTQMGSFKDKNDIIMIGHGDCLEDAHFVADLVKEKTGFTNFMFNYISPTIGAHSGPGTLALFHLGDTRMMK